MYIKRTVRRMMQMNKSTWMFITMCFAASYIYLISAMVMLIFAAGDTGAASAVKNAAELARMPQGIFIICALGSVIIEENLTRRD